MTVTGLMYAETRPEVPRFVAQRLRELTGRFQVSMTRIPLGHFESRTLHDDQAALGELVEAIRGECGGAPEFLLGSCQQNRYLVYFCPK